MNGYTPTTPYKARIQNLLYNIPVTERPKAIADAHASAKQEIENASKFDFERHLTAIVRRAQLEEAMDNEYPLTFSGGELDEARPYKMNTASMEEDLPF